MSGGSAYAVSREGCHRGLGVAAITTTPTPHHVHTTTTTPRRLLLPPAAHWSPSGRPLEGAGVPGAGRRHIPTPRRGYGGSGERLQRGGGSSSCIQEVVFGVWFGFQQVKCFVGCAVVGLWQF